MTRLRPWAGWIGAVAGWVLSDQAGSDLAQLDCASARPPVMLAIGAAGLFCVIGGSFMALSCRQSRADAAGGADVDRFIAGTGLLAAGIFALAIIFQTMASLIIPPCHA